MADVKWIKFLTDTFQDEKIRLIRSLPEGRTIILVWFQLLAQAGKDNAGGYVRLNERTPYSPKMLSVIFEESEAVITLALSTFESFGMIDRDGDGIYLTNWEKHQNVEGMERAREQARLRKQRQREKEKALPAPESHDVTRDVTGQVTGHHAVELDIDIEKETNIVCADASDYEQKILDVLQRIEGYPFDAKTDLASIRKWVQKYSTVDVASVVEDYEDWRSGKVYAKKESPRGQINTFLKKESEKIAQRKSADSPPSNYQPEFFDTSIYD